MHSDHSILEGIKEYMFLSSATQLWLSSQTDTGVHDTNYLVLLESECTPLLPKLSN